MKKKPAAAIDILKLLKKLEWSGQYQDNTGSRMGYSDGPWYEACPICNGCIPSQHPPKDINGHKKKCELQEAIWENGG